MNTILRITLYILGGAFLIGALLYAHVTVRSLWSDVALRQALLRDVPARTSKTSALKKELDTALLSMESIHATIPPSDDLVAVVSAISSAAISSGISAQVPVVQTTAKTVSTTDIFSDVRIRVVASGTPGALASFLYKVEHLPYMLRVASWKIDTLQQTAVSSFTSDVPTGTIVATPPLGSSLEADIALVTRKK